MKIFKLLLSLFLLFDVVGPLQGSETTDQALTLKRCLEIVLTENPQLLSSRALYEASQARVRQARELLSPSLSYDSDLQPGPFDFAGAGETYFGINQTLEFPGRRILRGRIAARESEQVSADIDVLKQDLFYQVKEAFYVLLLTGEKILYADQDLDLARNFLDAAEAKFAAGDTPEVEVLRARVEAAKAESGLVIARNERRLAVAVLNFLLGRGPADKLDIRDVQSGAAPNLDPIRLRDLAFASRPELRRIRSAGEGEALKIKQARMSYWPDFDLGLSQHKIAGEGASWDFTLSLNVPLFFWQPARGAIAEAVAASRAIRLEDEHLHNQIAREVEEAVASAAAARDRIRLYEDRILGPAESVYQAFLYRYQKGDIGGIELIEARRTLLEARRSYADARLNLHVTLAALEKAIGRSFEGVSDEK